MTDLPYTSIALPDVEPVEAAAWLAENNYAGAVSPQIDDITIIYDRVFATIDLEDEDSDPVEALLKLASEISYELGCTAWLTIAEDGDEAVFIYSLYTDGDLINSYGAKAGEPVEGGDAKTLANTFQLPKRTIKEIRAVLNRNTPHGTDRHRKLLETLGAPMHAVGINCEMILAGQLPEGVESMDDMIFIDVYPDDSDEDAAE